MPTLKERMFGTTKKGRLVRGGAIGTVILGGAVALASRDGGSPARIDILPSQTPTASPTVDLEGTVNALVAGKVGTIVAQTEAARPTATLRPIETSTSTPTATDIPTATAAPTFTETPTFTVTPTETRTGTPNAKETNVHKLDYRLADFNQYFAQFDSDNNWVNILQDGGANPKDNLFFAAKNSVPKTEDDVNHMGEPNVDPEKNFMLGHDEKTQYIVVADVLKDNGVKTTKLSQLMGGSRSFKVEGGKKYGILQAGFIGDWAQSTAFAATLEVAAELKNPAVWEMTIAEFWDKYADLVNDKQQEIIARSAKATGKTLSKKPSQDVVDSMPEELYTDTDIIETCEQYGVMVDATVPRADGNKIKERKVSYAPNLKDTPNTADSKKTTFLTAVSFLMDADFKEVIKTADFVATDRAFFDILMTLINQNRQLKWSSEGILRVCGKIGVSASPVPGVTYTAVASRTPTGTPVIFFTPTPTIPHKGSPTPTSVITVTPPESTLTPRPSETPRTPTATPHWTSTPFVPSRTPTPWIPTNTPWYTPTQVPSRTPAATNIPPVTRTPGPQASDTPHSTVPPTNYPSQTPFPPTGIPAATATPLFSVNYERVREVAQAYDRDVLNILKQPSGGRS